MCCCVVCWLSYVVCHVDVTLRLLHYVVFSLCVVCCWLSVVVCRLSFVRLHVAVCTYRVSSVVVVCRLFDVCSLLVWMRGMRCL